MISPIPAPVQPAAPAQQKKLSIEQLTQEAKQGDAEAQYKLGVAYYEGKGVLLNFRKAAHWFLQASEQGHVRAQYNLGLCYNNGQGVPKNHDVSRNLITQAAEQGYAEAQYFLGLL